MLDILVGCRVIKQANRSGHNQISLSMQFLSVQDPPPGVFLLSSYVCAE